MRSAYIPHERVTKSFPFPTLAKQSMQDECDINNIMRKFAKTGLISHVNEHNGQYGNFLNHLDYQSNQQALIDAQQAFNSLPSAIRKEFDNNPATFLEFAQDEKNIDKMVKMGLSKAPKVPIVAPDPNHPGTPAATKKSTPKASPEAKTSES